MEPNSRLLLLILGLALSLPMSSQMALAGETLSMRACLLLIHELAKERELNWSRIALSKEGHLSIDADARLFEFTPFITAFRGGTVQLEKIPSGRRFSTDLSFKEQHSKDETTLVSEPKSVARELLTCLPHEVLDFKLEFKKVLRVNTIVRAEKPLDVLPSPFSHHCSSVVLEKTKGRAFLAKVDYLFQGQVKSVAQDEQISARDLLRNSFPSLEFCDRGRFQSSNLSREKAQCLLLKLANPSFARFLRTLRLSTTDTRAIVRGEVAENRKGSHFE